MRSENPALAARMPAQVDDLLAEVDTPALVIDLYRFERNLVAMTEAVRGNGVRLRPHDAGLKAFSVDSGLPLVADRPELECTKASDEHGVLRVSSGAKNLRVGDKIRLVPGHCDPTVNLHDWLVGVRKGRVECVSPVSARGALL